MNSDDEKIANKAKIDKAKQLAKEKKTEFDTIQKEADDIALTDIDDNIEIINIVNGREEGRIKAAKEEEDRLIREVIKLTRIESEEKERLLEEARVIAAKEEEDRLGREAEELAEKARQKAEERAPNQALLEEKARQKAEALKCAHSKALVEKKARKQAEAEEQAHNQALVEEKARKKAETKILLAVGPEGGWAEPYELDLFKEHDFQQITLGTGILRSDVAVVSLLSLAHDVCGRRRNE
jgi:hypothetical protein